MEAEMADSRDTELWYCYNCMNHLDAGQDICPVCGWNNTVVQNPVNTLPEGTVLAGKYLIGKMLGQGGFGITYLGFDLALDVRVAVKEFFPVGVCMRARDSIFVVPLASASEPGDFQKSCEEFQTEAKRLARFNSPNIVHVRDYFRENETAYIVMDYVEGNSLTKEVAELGGRIPWERVLALTMPLMQELDKLHEEHLIHRDIKPDNLKIVKDKKPGKEYLILLDFGSARSFISESITRTYTAMVTPGYSPFEQYTSRSRQGPYTDVYALCATIYALICGELPASATDRVGGIADIRSFSSFGLDVPASVEEVIQHGLAVQSADRPQTMLALYDEFTRALEPSEYKTEPVVSQTETQKFDSGQVTVETRIPEPVEDQKVIQREPVKSGKKKSGKPVFVFFLILLIAAGVFYFIYPSLNLFKVPTQTPVPSLEAGTIISLTPEYTDTQAADSITEINPVYEVSTPSDGTYLYVGTSVDLDKVRFLTNGEKVVLTGETKTTGGYEWVHVRAINFQSQNEGWIQKNTITECNPD